MALEVSQATGLPLAEGLDESISLPHTIAYAVIYRSRVNGLQELPKDKRPPRNLWDKPFKLQEFLDDVFSTQGDQQKKQKEYIDIDLEDVE